MSTLEGASDDHELSRQIAVWRPRLEGLGLFLALSSLVVTLGAVVAGLALEPHALDYRLNAWDRLKVVGHGTADPGVLGAGALTLALVLLLRVLFRWPDSTPSGVARASIVVVMVTATWQVIARGVFLAAVVFAADGGWLGVHTGYHQAEATLAVTGTGLAAAVLIGAGARGLGLLSGENPRPEPLATSLAQTHRELADTT